MSRKPRPPEEVEQVRQEILEKALELINEEGYASFSMRKLAVKLNMTATTIYQYYANKDELYLAALAQGFEDLTAVIEAARGETDDPVDRLRTVLREIIRFGTVNPNVYNIMLVSSVPKYYDYVGTPNEEAAFRELGSALKSRDLMVQTIIESGLIKEEDPDEARMAAIDFVCAGHGFINLINSHITDYLFETKPDPDSDAMIEAFLNTTMKRFGAG